jgi:hypothetical protein
MKIFFFMAILLLCGAISVGAQQPLVGLIQGVIRDQATHPIAEVALTATNLDSGANRYSVTDSGGAYQFVEVPPGRYSIKAQKTGYRDVTLSLVTVSPGQTVDSSDMTMVPAQATRTAQ